MIRKILAAVLRFIHNEALLLKIADYLEQPPIDEREPTDGQEITQ